LLLGGGGAFAIYFVMNWRKGIDDSLQSGTARAISFSALTTGTGVAAGREHRVPRSSAFN
jgi:uncharacterized protein